MSMSNPSVSTNVPSPVNTGLEGVVVAETIMSQVDGLEGRLTVRGHDVAEVARMPFEAVVAHLWSGDGATGAVLTAEEVRVRLARARCAVWDRLSRLDWAESSDAMVALRSALSRVGSMPVRGDLEQALLATATCAVATAAWVNAASGRHAVAPSESASHAADVLRMCSVIELESTSEFGHVGALNAYWGTVVDHGLNASTFTARVIASTGSDLFSAVIGALGALKGPLHGGAPGPVLDMLDEIEVSDRAAPWLEDALAHGRRIMGMGHRVYRVRDPRALVLSQVLARLPLGAAQDRLELAATVEATAERLLAVRYPNRNLRANVEFYTAVVLEALGFPRLSFSSLFACSRVVGWAAHVFEQRYVGRIIRPSSRYVGP